MQNPTDVEIVEALEKLVADGVTPGTFVILEADSNRNYYIQFAIQGDRLFCEAVSNEYLEGPAQLDDSQLRALENLRWREPEHEGQNWFRTFRPTAREDFVEIVGLVRRAFVEVYGLDPDNPLEMIRSWDGQVLAPETSITFASEGHRSTYERVASYVAEAYEDVNIDARRPLLFIQHGSTIVSVAINPVEIHSSIVDLYSLLVRDVEGSAELFDGLLQTNYAVRLGALAVDGDGDIVLKHTLFGDTLTREELQTVLMSFVDLADALDDEIVGRFGGYTARDWTHR